jgi:cobalt-precorrin-5B (C1)-methyltransferase
MQEQYVIKKGKKLRYGYTTGSCAAAAAKAAAYMLLHNEKIHTCTIDTPRGWRLELGIGDITLDGDHVECSVTKDAGDDPDITNGIRIFARARKLSENKIIITAGKGIGIVTKRGLAVDVGKPAINPVPMKMIRDEIGKLNLNSGIEIEISAPDGALLAKKTFNPRLGIVDGISILGTSGIVDPMSCDAIKDSIAFEISIAREAGFDSIALCPGNDGKACAIRDLGIDPCGIIIAGNFIGDMLEAALYYKTQGLLLVGHIGKLIKVAGGIFNTHSRYADARLEILAAHYGCLTGDSGSVQKIMSSNTTEEALLYITDQNFYRHITNMISRRCAEYVNDSLMVGCAMFSQHKGLLGMSDNAGILIDRIKGK